MSDATTSGYLPGDPRYGLQGDALKNYYRTKPAEWAIYCWDEPGKRETRRALLPEQNDYVKGFGERVIGYGHFVSTTAATRWGRRSSCSSTTAPRPTISYPAIR
jgi:hypothetical protein